MIHFLQYFGSVVGIWYIFYIQIAQTALKKILSITENYILFFFVVEK